MCQDHPRIRAEREGDERPDEQRKAILLEQSIQEQATRKREDARDENAIGRIRSNTDRHVEERNGKAAYRMPSGRIELMRQDSVGIIRTFIEIDRSIERRPCP